MERNKKKEIGFYTQQYFHLCMYNYTVFTQQYMHPWVNHALSLLIFNSDQCEGILV